MGDGGPRWARGQALAAALSAQLAVDPDEIFQLHAKTCPLSEVFAEPGVQTRLTARPAGTVPSALYTTPCSASSAYGHLCTLCGRQCTAV